MIAWQGLSCAGKCSAVQTNGETSRISELHCIGSVVTAYSQSHCSRLAKSVPNKADLGSPAGSHTVMLDAPNITQPAAPAWPTSS